MPSSSAVSMDPNNSFIMGSPPPPMNICRTSSMSSSLRSFIMFPIMSFNASGLLYISCAAFIPCAALANKSGSPNISFIWSMLSFIFCSKYSGSALNLASSSASTAPVSSNIARISSWLPSMLAIMSSPLNKSIASCICLAKSSGDMFAIIAITSSKSGMSAIPASSAHFAISSGSIPICFIMASRSPRPPPAAFLACSLSSWKLEPVFFLPTPKACPSTVETVNAEKVRKPENSESFIVFFYLILQKVL
mmetsp:Transcript_13354/g.33602  ORF Transcript_13354/g.33602 Transcript_13354/m.33602 type:complete len:250 (-) Transcript_13354:83-832(-)